MDDEKGETATSRRVGGDFSDTAYARPFLTSRPLALALLSQNNA